MKSLIVIDKKDKKQNIQAVRQTEEMKEMWKYIAEVKQMFEQDWQNGFNSLIWILKSFLIIHLLLAPPVSTPGRLWTHTLRL